MRMTPSAYLKDRRLELPDKLSKTAKNPEKIKIRWAVGNLYGPFREMSKRDGSRLISYDSFRRKSGLKVHCAVWHKKK